MNEAELALRMLAVEVGVPLHRRGTVRADLNHGDPIEDATVLGGMRLESFDDEPLVGMSSTDLGPTHGRTVAALRGIDNFSIVVTAAQAAGRSMGG